MTMEMVLMASALVTVYLILALDPLRAFVVVCFTCVWFPTYLTLDVGTLNFTVTRIATLTLIAKLILTTHKFEQLRFRMLDALVILVYLCQSLALFMNEPVWVALERQSGVLLDTVALYFLARAILVRLDQIFLLIKSLLLLSIPLALLGMVDCVTGWNPFFDLQLSLDPDSNFRSMRMGLYRSMGTFVVHIIFGLYFTALFVLSLSLWHDTHWSRSWVAFLAIVMLMGVISSMSTAPLLAVFIAIVFLFTYPLRRLWYLVLVFGIALCVVLEFYSNRHFYEIPTRIAFNSTTSYYRVALIEEAFTGGMDGHWLFGYGLVGNDSSDEKFPWVHKDLTNLYIHKLALYGLFGLIPYLCMNLCFYCFLYQAYCRSRYPTSWFVWCLLGLMISWNLAMLTVNSFDVVDMFLYIFLALCAGLPAMVSLESRQLATAHEEPLRTFTNPSWEALR